MSVIGIEEHWTHGGIDRALRALPPARADAGLALHDRGDTADRLADLGGGREAAMAEQGVDMHVLGLAPPGTQGLDSAEAVHLSQQANDQAAAAVLADPDRL